MQLDSRETKSIRRIVIVGGGFGGVYTAINLEKRLRGRDDVEITLISQENFFLMTPFLFEAGSGVLDPRHAVAPIRRLLDAARFVEADIDHIDFEKRIVGARHSMNEEPLEVPFDQLVIALGGITNTKIIPGSELALTFKTLADGIYLRNHVIDAFEHADVLEDGPAREKLLTFVIIGAGLVGVELMGELTSFVQHIGRSYPVAGKVTTKFHLIEGGPNVLPEMERDLADYAATVLERRGVKIYRSMPVTQVEEGAVHLKDGTHIAAHTIILAAGVAPNPMLESLSLEKSPKGRLTTDATMRCAGTNNVWAIGDCASIPNPEGKPYPQLAQHALREARLLATNIANTVNNLPTRPFVYQTLGTLASLGDFTGVGRVWKFKVRGFIAWWVWRTYYLMQMPRFERKVRIVLDWTIALFFNYDIVKLDLFGHSHPAAKKSPNPQDGQESPKRD